MLGKPGENEARKFPRTPVRLKVCLVISEQGQVFSVTRDISDGGLFVQLDADKVPDIGHEVNVQVQGLPNGMEAPWINMRVVRTDAEGIGLMIVDSVP